MVKYVGLYTVTHRYLMLEKRTVLCIRFFGDVKFDQSVFMYGNHVVKTKDSVSARLQFENMLAGFYVDVVRLRRLHGDKILESGKGKDNSHIRTAGTFIILHTGITAVQIANVMICYSV